MGKNTYLSYHIGNKLFWFRIKGYGLSFEITERKRFSERNNLKKFLRIRNLLITPLT